MVISFQMIQSQVIEPTTDKSSQELFDFYALKQRKNKTTAWVMLGAGIGMTIAGIGINMSSGILDGDSTNNDEGLWLSYLGGATTIASVPFFIAAGKNKRKAKMYLNNSISKINFSQNRNFNCWSVSLMVPL